MLIFICRLFANPCPPQRIILDTVSSLTTAIILSLKCGLLRNCSFNVAVRRDVFNCLFNNCGNRVRRRLYDRCDFSDKFLMIVTLMKIMSVF